MGRSGCLIAVLAALLAGPAAAQTVRGRLLEDRTDRPIVNARLALLDPDGHSLDEALSDSTGRFTLATELPGRYRLRAQAEGYIGATTPAIELQSNTELHVRFLLSPEVVLLAPLEITARSRPLISGMTLAAFAERRAQGLGYAITQEDIEKQNPRAVSDLLRQVPGVRVDRTADGARIRIPGAGQRLQGVCAVKVVIDGTEFRWGSTTIDDIPVHDVWAIEVFRSLSETPVELASPDARCGVIAVWTRRGVR
jgi:hypothetical protein